jgi:hypothetical protein
MSRYKSLMTVCCAAVLTLGLAACGGGSDSDQAAAPPVEMPDPPTPMEQLEAAQGAVAAAQALVASATTPTEIAAAYNALAAAQAQLTAAESIPANQIAILAEQLRQLRMSLENTQMLAEQRGTVGAALIAAQNAVNGLSASSSDADAAAAAGSVAAAEAALAGASALPADDSLHGSVAAVAGLLASVEMSRTVYSQQGTVDTALTAAQMAVEGLSNASTDDDVAAASTLVADAQAALAAATALSADDSRHASVMGVYEDLGDAVTARTAHMDTQTINGLISTAQSAVGGLDQVNSSGADVEAARAAVMAVTEAIAASTALTEAEKTALSGMISMAVTDLQGVDEYRATAPGQLAVAEAALAHAQGLVDALTPTSTAAEAAEAYGALGDAQAAIHAARALPTNVIARLEGELTEANDDLGDANRLAGERETVGNAIVAATTAIAGLTADSTDAEIEAAKGLVAAAQTALDGTMELDADETAGLQASIANLTSQIGSIETLQIAAETERMQTEQRNAAVNALSMAQAAINALTEESSKADVVAARGLVTDAKTALDAATGLSQSERDGLQTLLNTASTSVTGYETIVAGRPTEAEIAVAAQKTKDAGTKAKAIGVEATATVNAGLGGNDGLGADGQPGGTDDTHSLTIKRPRSGTTIEIADSTMTGDDDPKFVEQDVDLGEVSDFARTMHRRINSDTSDEEDGSKVEEVVIVATDIDPPTATPFAMEHPLDARDLDEDVNADDMGSTTDDWTALTVAAGADDVNLPLIMASKFSAGTEATLTFKRDDNTTSDMDEAFETDGTYDGAEGTYRCNADSGDGCTVDIDEDGKISGIGAGWVFTPDSGETVDVADANYLSYGVWLQRTKDEDGVVTSYDEVETFTMANGHPETGDSDLADVEGTAIYTGGATGVYVKNVLDDQGNITSATSGQFKAAVTLNASFGGGNVAANDQFTIGGSITGFDLEHDEENDWEVSLGLTDLSGGRADDGNPGESGPGSSHNNVFSGVATGDSTAAAGTYNGTFYGSSADFDHDDDATTDPINPRPVAVLGEFNANFTDGTTAGAYGADRE